MTGLFSLLVNLLRRCGEPRYPDGSYRRQIEDALKDAQSDHFAPIPKLKVWRSPKGWRQGRKIA